MTITPSLNVLIDPGGFRTLLATAAEVEADGATVLGGVLLSLIVIYLASKLGGEICARINLPPVLGDLVGGVVVGISVLNLIVFPETGAQASDSLIFRFIEATGSLTPETLAASFSAESEVINILSELGVIILLFEIGLESELGELIKYGPQAAIVAVVGVVAPFAMGNRWPDLPLWDSGHSSHFRRRGPDGYQYWHYRQGASRNQQTQF